MSSSHLDVQNNRTYKLLVLVLHETMHTPVQFDPPTGIFKNQVNSASLTTLKLSLNKFFPPIPLILTENCERKPKKNSTNE